MINALVATPEDLDFRLHIRNEVIREGLAEALPGLREIDTEDLNVQLDIFDEHKDDDAVEFQHRFNDITVHLEDLSDVINILNTVVKDTPAESFYLSILQHLLLIRDDVFVRPQYFKLIDECVAQIVLQKSGVDPDFSARKLQIDIDNLIGKIFFWVIEFYSIFLCMFSLIILKNEAIQILANILEGQVEGAKVAEFDKKLSVLEAKVYYVLDFFS